MVNKEVVLGVVKENAEKHLERVANAIDWFNENLVSKDAEGFAGQIVMCNGVECVCVRHNFYGLAAEFNLIPRQSTLDAGSGIGSHHTKTF